MAIMGIAFKSVSYVLMGLRGGLGTPFPYLHKVLGFLKSMRFACAICLTCDNDFLKLITPQRLKVAYWTLFYSIAAIGILAVLWHNSLSHPGLCPVMILYAVEMVIWAGLSSEKWRRDVWW